MLVNAHGMPIDRHAGGAERRYDEFTAGGWRRASANFAGKEKVI
jgi:hypothetical protein